MAGFSQHCSPQNESDIAFNLYLLEDSVCLLTQTAVIRTAIFTLFEQYGVVACNIKKLKKSGILPKQPKTERTYNIGAASHIRTCTKES